MGLATRSISDALGLSTTRLIQRVQGEFAENLGDRADFIQSARQTDQSVQGGAC